MVHFQSTDTYHDNAARCQSGSTPCVICGKGIKDSSNPPMVRVHGGWGLIVTDEEAATMVESQDCGGWPIGRDCLKKHPEIKPYVTGGKA